VKIKIRTENPPYEQEILANGKIERGEM